jgi:Predicted membrane protein (DUF2306)
MNDEHLLSHDIRRHGVVRLLGGALVLCFTLMISVYGLLTLDSARSHYATADSRDHLSKIVALRDASDAGQWLESPANVAEYASGFITLLGLVSTPKHAFGTDSLGEHAMVYATASKGNGWTLAAHIALGSFCLIFGGLQFWPAFRRGQPKWHRRVGVGYFVSVQLSMIASFVYLIRTPVENILDQLFFVTGLWFLNIMVTVSLWMSLYSLAKRQYAQHQGWMWLNYGLLLSTPLLRIGWLAIGAVYPELHWVETNNAVSGVVIPLSIISTYAMFVISRSQQVERPPSNQAVLRTVSSERRVPGRLLALSVMLVLCVSAWLTTDHYLLGKGISSAMGAEELVPAEVRLNHDIVIGGNHIDRFAFVAAVLIGLLCGGRFFWSAFANGKLATEAHVKSAWGLSVSSFAIGCLLLKWGVALGAPGYTSLSGGALHVFGGGVSVLASIALALACHRKNDAWMKEFGLVVLTCICAPSSFFVTLPVLGLMHFDSHWISVGHLYRLAEAGQWLLLVGPFIYAIYGQATQQRIAR